MALNIPSGPFRIRRTVMTSCATSNSIPIQFWPKTLILYLHFQDMTRSHRWEADGASLLFDKSVRAISIA
jgi:hypothetical protein